MLARPHAPFEIMTTPAIRVTNMHKRFGGVHALRGVNLEVYPGEILGLVGHNGAGKSTLIRILTGDLHPDHDSGPIELDGQIIHLHSIRDSITQGVGAVRQELDLVPDLSIAENIYLGQEAEFTRFGFLDRRSMAAAARPIIEKVGLGIDPYRRLGDLSIGDQQLIAAARALRSAAHILLLDEPTSSLTPWEADRLFAQVRALADSGVAIIYISHRVDEVANLCHRVVVLRDGMVVGEFRQPADSQKEIVDTMAPGGTSVSANGRRAAGEVLLEVRNLRVGRHGPASFQLRAGEIVGFFGLIGAGRTTLARALVGDIHPDEGEVLFKGETVTIASPYHGYQKGIAYLSENRKTEGIFPGMNVRSNMGLRTPQNTARYGWVRQGSLRQLVSRLIDKLSILPGNQELSIEALSGGNQQKTILGRLLADTLEVFILDEPTHGIDVSAKADLLRLLNELANQGKAVAFISSELPELMNVSDRVLVMQRGKVVREFDPKAALERDLVGAAVGETTL